MADIFEISGRIHSTSQEEVVTTSSEILDEEQNKKQSEVNADVDTALAYRYTKEETYSKSQLDNLITTPDVQYVTVATYSALPATGSADTIYRVASWDGSAVDAGKYSEYAWNGTAYQLLAVRSGSIDGVFDISQANASGGVPATYDNLAAAISGTHVPEGVRAGGMSVKYIENVYADYGVVVTEGLETQPTGTALQSAPSITNGVYKASHLSAFAPLPSTIGASNTYYIAVTVDETTTYTKWVVKKWTADSEKYVQKMLMATEWSTDVNNWLSIDLINELDAQVGETKYINIPFDANNTYIKPADGTTATSYSYKATQYVSVKEGDEFYYTGNTGAGSVAVEGYEYNGSSYVPKVTLLPVKNALQENKYILIPSGVTHIVAACVNTSISSASLRKIERSTLGQMQENLGELSYTNIISGYESGYYVNTNGQWVSLQAGLYKFIDVNAGDNIELYDATAVANICIISQKLTDTKFKPLVNLSPATYDKVVYIAGEPMTICISGTFVPRLTIVRYNKIDGFEYGIESLQQRQNADEQYKKWLEEYDFKLGHIFDGIAVIGDSMSSGTLQTSGVSTVVCYGASWLSFLAKRWGCISKFHYASPSTSTYTWLNNGITTPNTYGLGKFLKDVDDGKLYNAYFIAYGHNDGNDTTHIPTVGSATDTKATVTVTDYVPICSSGSSFCAYYKAIIEQIREKAPHAMIFCLPEYDDVMDGSQRTSYRQAIIDIVDFYREQGDNLIFSIETGGVHNDDMVLLSHYSTIGYDFIAKKVDEAVNKVIYENMSDDEIKLFGVDNLPLNDDSPLAT